jgi:hypothetical protein
MHPSALIIGGRTNTYLDPTFQQAAAAGAKVIMYLNPTVVISYGKYHGIIYPANTPLFYGGSLKRNTLGTTFPFADNSVAAQRARVAQAYAQAFDELPWLVGAFADDLGSGKGSCTPGLDSWTAQQNTDWYNMSVAVAQTIRGVCDSYGKVVFHNATWAARVGWIGNAGGYPNTQLHGCSLADGGCIEGHGNEIAANPEAGNFWDQYIGEPVTGYADQWKDDGLHIAINDLASETTKWTTRSRMAYACTQTDYAQAGPVWGSFHTNTFGSTGGGGGDPTSVPAAPTGVSVTPGNGYIDVSWSANPAGDQVSTYQVYVNDSNTHPLTNLNVGNVLTYRINGATNGTTYNIRVGAYNVVGYGGWSTPALPATPQAATSTVGVSKQLVWKVRKTVNEQKQLVWNVGSRFAVGAQRTYLWNLRKGITSERILRWNVDYNPGPPPVLVGDRGVYVPRADILVDRTTPIAGAAEILTSTSGEPALSITAVPGVVGDMVSVEIVPHDRLPGYVELRAYYLDTVWKVRGKTARDLWLAAGGRNPRPAPVRLGVISPRVVPQSPRQALRRRPEIARRFRPAAAGLAGPSVPTAPEDVVQSGVAAAVTRLKWHTAATTPLSRTLKWDVSSAFTPGASRMLKWNVRKAVSASRSLKWNVEDVEPIMGIALGGTWQALTQTVVDSRFDAMQAAGVRAVRFDISWRTARPTEGGAYVWTAFDRLVTAAVSRGMKVLAILDNAPDWAAAATGGWYPPDTPSEFAQFCADAAARYSPQGVHWYEIWNEPNIIGFWKSSPNVVAYANLLKAAYPAIKAVDSQAVVISGGLSPAVDDATHIAPNTFLAGLYSNGCKDYMDAVGWHPYSSGNMPSQYATWSGWSQMSETPTNARAIMTANGDSAKRIWGTEIGKATGGTGGSVVTEDVQAASLTEAYALGASYDWLGPIFWYSWVLTESGSYDQFYGFFRSDGSEKPALAAFTDAVQGSAVNVGISKVVKWNVRKAAESVRIMKWNVRKAINATRALVWNVQAGTTGRNPNNITTLIDAFTRANTGPPPGPAWTTPLWSGESGLVTNTNQLAASAGGWRGDYITSPANLDQCGIKYQIPVLPAAGETIYTFLATAGLGGSPTGYALRWIKGTGFLLVKYSAGSPTDLNSSVAETGNLVLSAGGWIALIQDATTVEGYVSNNGTTWYSVGSAADTSLSKPFYGGIEVISTTVRIDNVYFGAA